MRAWAPGLSLKLEVGAPGWSGARGSRPPRGPSCTVTRVGPGPARTRREPLLGHRGPGAPPGRSGRPSAQPPPRCLGARTMGRAGPGGRWGGSRREGRRAWAREPLCAFAGRRWAEERPPRNPHFSRALRGSVCPASAPLFFARSQNVSGSPRRGPELFGGVSGTVGTGTSKAE